MRRDHRSMKPSVPSEVEGIVRSDRDADAVMLHPSRPAAIADRTAGATHPTELCSIRVLRREGVAALAMRLSPVVIATRIPKDRENDRHSLIR
jgi:hypothetical protein